MNRAVLLAFAALCALAARSGAVDPKQRTDSGQFTVYCENVELRRQVASFAVQTKDQVLAMLGESDTWRRPIVLTIDNASSPSQPLADLRVIDSAVGMKIEIAVNLRTETQDVNLQKYLVRALLLEYMYRRTGVTGGAAYVEPPWWLVEGVVQKLRQRESGLDTDFYRKLVETNKLPPIEDFLRHKPDELGPTALAMDGALAMCLLQLLIDQPSGRDHLAAFLRAWPAADGDSIAALGRQFRALSGGAAAIQKWWVLNLARFAAADRYRGLTAEESDRQVVALLEFDIKNPKTGQTQRYSVEQFAEYLKIPGSRQVLATQRAGLVALSPRANALLRPVIAEYEQALALLERGKSRGMKERLERAGQLRSAIVRRIDEIADYMNWFEATQLTGSSRAFEGYLKTANELSEQDKLHRDPIARYLDSIAKEY
jgi:hypothetical protein